MGKVIIKMGSVKKDEINKLSSKVIGAALEVHRILGPGLLEKAYEGCLCQEFSLQGINYERQKYIPLIYKGKEVDYGYKADLLVEENIV